MFVDTASADRPREQYIEFLDAGELRFQRCTACQHAWLPPRAHCPDCLSDVWTWEPATGRGQLVSWVTYHRAPQPAFADRVPYNVSVVELAEGPRLISRLSGDPETLVLSIGLPLRLIIVKEEGVALPTFEVEAQPTRPIGDQQ